jgi:hypothetical protein
VILALLVLALLAAALMLPIAVRAARSVAGRRGRRLARRAERRELRDPGRERRAEQRARELLRSCVNDEEWAMYRDLGFIRVLGRLQAEGPHGLSAPRRRFRGAGSSGEANSAPARSVAGSERQASYAYLIYPHKPIVAYVPRTGRLLSEYCVEFPELAGAISQSRLPDSDDVLAKWMALTADERRLISESNMHLPGRQIDPARVRRDLWRLREWERLRRGPDAPVAPGR